VSVHLFLQCKKIRRISLANVQNNEIFMNTVILSVEELQGITVLQFHKFALRVFKNRMFKESCCYNV
jgi:hypothetical protein